MISYIVKRLFQGILTVWFIATATFFAMHNVPGDPLLNDRAVSDAIRANLESKYGLDQPLSTFQFQRSLEFSQLSLLRQVGFCLGHSLQSTAIDYLISLS